MLLFNLRSLAAVEETSMRRDWRRYSRDSLNLELSKVNWSTDFDCVQSYWNAFENMLIVVVDKVAPMVLFVNHSIKQKLMFRLTPALLLFFIIDIFYNISLL